MTRRIAGALAIAAGADIHGTGTAQNDVMGRIRVSEKDLKQNAILMAWFAWQAANTDQRLPRPESATSGR